MRRVFRALAALMMIAAGCIGAGAWWYVARAAGHWPILVQQANGNLVLVNQQGNTRQVTTDADGRTLAYLFSAPAPDGRSIATVAVRTDPANPTATLMIYSLDGRRVTLYDDPDHSPFYLSWSPDSQKIAFLASTGMDLTLHGISVNGNEPPKDIAEGGPLYFAWSPDSERLLIHVGGGTPSDSLLMYRWGEDKPEPIKADLAYFNTPTWMPNGQHALVALGAGSDAVLAAIDTQGNIVQPLANLASGTLFVPSPDKQQIAYVSLDENTLGQLRVVEIGGDNERTVSLEPAVTFFWSPQGDKLAFLSPVSGTRDISTRQAVPSLRWNVWTKANGNLEVFEPFQPSAAFMSLLPYFDQYAQSIRLWDVTGTQLIYASTEGVHILDVVNDRTRRVSDGVLGMWME